MAKKENKPQFSPEEPTPEEVEAERIARENRRKKGKAVDPEPTPEPVVDSPDNDITSIRTATPEDPTGQNEIIIDNNTPVEEDDNGDSGTSESQLSA